MSTRKPTESHSGDQRVTPALLDAIAIIDDAVILIDAQQQIVYVNQGAEKLFGYTAAEMTDAALSQLLPPDLAKHHSHHVKAFLSGTGSTRRMNERGSLAGLRKDGRIFPAEASIARIDVRHQTLAMAIVRDISLRASTDAVLRTLAETSNAMISIIDANRHFIYVNPSFQRITGYSQTELLRSFDISSLVHPQDLSRLRQRRYGIVGQHRVKSKAGDWIWLEGERHKILLDGIEQMVTVDRNITTRKVRELSAERNVHLAEEQLALMRQLFDGIDQRIYMVDKQWRYIFCNQATLAFLGVTASDIIGRTMWDRFPDFRGTQLASHFERAMTSKATTGFREYYPPEDRWVQVQLYPTPRGLVVLTMDIPGLGAENDEESQLYRAADNLKGNLNADMQATLGLMPDPVLMLDDHFQILYANDAALHTGGHSSLSNILGQTPWQIAPSLQGTDLENRFRAAMADGKRAQFIYLDQSTAKWYRVRLIPSIQQLIIFAVDITEEKRFEASAQLLTKTLEQALDVSWNRTSQRDPHNRAHRGK